MDLVWNRIEAEQVRQECESALRRQIGHMQNTLEAYRRAADELERQANEQAHIAVTAMRAEITDIGEKHGTPHIRMVEDIIAR
ncbi:MAG: hypothetical protein LBC73_07180, partial [Oscillospiraceae bacterium]|nr:hypothetical protein [Oscillospiraceae bacterium]